jgi:hypothetical protein
MAVPDANERWEEHGPSLRGVHSGVDLLMLPKNSLAWGVNIDLTDGMPATRPAIVHRAFLPSGKLQGACYYENDEGAMVSVVDGIPYLHNIVNDIIYSQSIKPPGPRNSRIVPFAYFAQIAQHLIIQDGISKPIIFDGGASRRAVDGEVPVGTWMAAGNGRLWVMRNREVFAGDLYGVSENSHLLFDENAYLAEGGSFLLPGQGTGMAFLPRLDNATEYGDLICFTANSITTIKAQVTDRMQWKNIVMQRLLFPNIGCVSGISITPVNQDLYFLSSDGLRSLRNTMADLQDAGVTPISREAARLFDYDSPKWWKYQPGVYFRNRLLVGVNPRLNRHESAIDGEPGYNVACEAMASLNFAPSATMAGDGAPVWEGEWTGIHPKFFVKGNFVGRDRLFIFGNTCDGQNAIWELVPGQRYDRNSTGEVRITSTVELPMLAFGAPRALKTLKRGEVFFSSAEGQVDWSLLFREDRSMCWKHWKSGSFCTAYDRSEIDAATGPKDLRKGYAYRIEAGEPASACNEYSGRQVGTAYFFQPKIQWTGRAKLDMAFFRAILKDQSTQAAC